MLWDANFSLPQLALERDSGGTLIRRYTYGNSRISMTTPQTTAYSSADFIGSVSELSGTGGTLLGQYDNQPFGDGASSGNVDPSAAGNPFGFAGEYQDTATGLYDLRARNYDPTTARSLSPDPLGPQDASSGYTYVGDNPLGYVDPSGMKRDACGSIGCFLKNSALPACLNAINPLAGNGLPIGVDIVKTAALHRWEGHMAKTALTLATKEIAMDFPIATVLVCLNAGAMSGFTGDR